MSRPADMTPSMTRSRPVLALSVAALTPMLLAGGITFGLIGDAEESDALGAQLTLLEAAYVAFDDLDGAFAVGGIGTTYDILSCAQDVF